MTGQLHGDRRRQSFPAMTRELARFARRQGYRLVELVEIIENVG
jgi:hypothetical protein